MDLSVAVYRISTVRWRPPAKAAFDQLGRASLSVPLNIAEGYVWRPGKRWVFHLRVALGSAVETTDLLRFLGEVEVLSEAERGPLEQGSRRAQALIMALLRRESGGRAPVSPFTSHPPAA
jgi:four helix bundle protein